MTVIAAHKIIVRTVEEIEPVVILRASPRRGIVANPAVSCQSCRLMTGVARIQITGLVTAVTLGRRIAVVSPDMAVFAIDRTVPPVKNEAGLNMEKNGRNPAGRGVAFTAIADPELIAVRVCVATCALSVDTCKYAAFMAIGAV